MTLDNWIPVESRLPPPGIPVETKIDDADGCRNGRVLKRISRLWFYPDDSMYVYYEPTHWRPRMT
jgi:hypothetical protein